MAGPPDDSSSNSAFAPRHPAGNFSGYLPEALNYGTGYGLDAAIPQEYKMASNHTGQRDAMSFNFPTANGHLSQDPAGVPQQYPPVASSHHTVGQESMQVSPVAISQTPITTRPATALVSPKRGGDPVNGMFEDQRRGSSKRQRLDLTIETATPASWTNQYSQQPNHFRAATPQRSSAVNSVDYGSTGVPLSAGSLDRSRSNSNAIPGYLSRSQAPWTALSQEPNYSQARGYDEAPTNSNVAPSHDGSYDSHRPSSFSLASQHMPSASLGYDSRFSSLSGVAGLPYGAAERMNPYYPVRQPFDVTTAKPKQSSDGRFSLIVKQQPERARLCSFKEENDTSEYAA